MRIAVRQFLPDGVSRDESGVQARPIKDLAGSGLRTRS